jgi:tetratricopeptide (TPR) repeat protein
MPENELQEEKELNFRDLFIPLTNRKVISFIIIIGIITYFNMLFNGFVWDDKTYILFNPDIQTFNVFNLIKTNIFNAGGQYRPIPGLYFASLFALFKETTFFYHLLQVLIHILNTSLLFILFSKFFNKKVSLLLSLLFLIHPIQVESVSYIASSDNPLFFLFGLLAVILSLPRKIRTRRYIGISFLLFLSLLTKEAGILFLFIILLYTFLYKKKEFFPFIFTTGAAFVVYLLVRFGIGGVSFTNLPLIPIARLSFVERLINLPAIIFYYLKTFFFPLHLAVDQQWIIRSITFENFYFPLVVDFIFFLCICLLGLYIYKKNKINFKIFLFFFCWFLAGLTVYSQIVPLDGTVADRWFYFPLVGIVGLLGIALQSIKFVSKPIKTSGYALIIVIFVLSTLRTMVRNTNWGTPITLFSNDVQISDNFDIENNLGTEYSNIHDYKNAIIHSRKSVQMFPYEANTYNLANTYEQAGDIQNAKKYYAQALASQNYLPINHEHFNVTYIRLAYIYYLTNHCKDAEVVIHHGLQEYPTSPYLWIELAACEYKLGNQTKSLEYAEKAKTFLPDEQMNVLYLQIQNKEKINLKL